MAVSFYQVSALVGSLTICYTGYHLLSVLRYHLYSSKIHRYHHPPRQSSDASEKPWALVTGASDGIGLAFANELAARDFNVVLHGRNGEKLGKVIGGLQQQYKVTFKPLVLNATTPASAAFDETVLSCVKGLNLTVVIHNVSGFGGANPEMKLFEELPTTECDGWIDVNARFVTHLTRLLLPKLIANQPGLMLFVSSGVTEIVAPYVSLYTASKYFIEGLTRALRIEMELQGHDIEMKALVVGTVATASSGRSEKDVSFTMPTTRQTAKSSLSKVGWGSPRVNPWIGHWLQFTLIKALPLRLQDKILISISKGVKEKMMKGQ